MFGGKRKERKNKNRERPVKSTNWIWILKYIWFYPIRQSRSHLPWMGRVLQQCSSQEDQEDLNEHESCSQISYTNMDHHHILTRRNLNIVEKLQFHQISDLQIKLLDRESQLWELVPSRDLWECCVWWIKLFLWEKKKWLQQLSAHHASYISGIQSNS